MNDPIGSLAPSVMARQVAHTFAARVGIAVARALVLLALARVLAPAEFGAYVLVISTIAIAIGVVGLGASSYVYRAVPGMPEGPAHRVFSSVASFEICAALLVVTLAVASGALDALTAFLGATDFEAVFRLGAILLVIEVAFQQVVGFTLARQQIGKANVLEVIHQAGWILLLAVAWLAGISIDARSVLVLTIIAAALACVVGAAMVLNRDALSAPRMDDISRALTFSAPLLLTFLAGAFLRHGDRYILAASRTLSEVAIYGFAWALANLIYSFSSQVIGTALVPGAIEAHNRGDAARRDHLLWLTLKYGAWLLVAGALAGALTLPFVLALLRPEYVSALHLFAILALAQLLLVIAAPAANYLYMHDRTRSILVIDTVGMTLAVGLGLLLIPTQGAVGAALAAIVGSGAIAVMKHVRSGLWQHLPWREWASFGREARVIAAWMQR